MHQQARQEQERIISGVQFMHAPAINITHTHKAYIKSISTSQKYHIHIKFCTHYWSPFINGEEE